MAIESFDKNIVRKEPEAIERLVDALVSKDRKPINTKLASDAMAKGENLLEQCLLNRNEIEMTFL